jgi:hypothetical protein
MNKPCPNCEAAMDEGDACPECDHDKFRSKCPCAHCEAERFTDYYEDDVL